jgi:4-diphosphocytidyl-2-C-methyl-D-erythritol kinase
MTLPPDTVEVEARAKVNLSLRVLGADPDGYHRIDSVLVTLDLADRLMVHAAADPSFRTLSLSLDVGGDPSLVAGVPVDESNLALRAAAALAEAVGVRGFADVTLDKRIPVGAGLGGGSADAAAVLRALDDLWGAGLGWRRLAEVGASVGSDVPALVAGGAVRARGRGEVVTRIEAAPLRWALVTRPFEVRAGDAYRWWDEDGRRVGSDVARVVGAAAEGPDALGPLLSNDLEPPVVRRHPELAEVKAALLDAGCAGAILSGSGPTVAGLLPSGVAGEEVADRMVASIGWRPILAGSAGSVTA